MKDVKIKVLSVAICLLLTLGIVLVIRGRSFFVNLVEDFRGYDYESRIEKGLDWTGPRRGEIIDLDYLVDKNGVTLHEFPKNDLILLTVIDTRCGGCKLTREQFRYLDENLDGKNVDRFMVCFSPNVSPLEMSEYVKSLNLNTNSLTWTNGLGSVLSSINTIAFPSHILMDSRGAVIKSFAGTNFDKSVRDRMARQVLQEVMEEKNRRAVLN